MSIFKNDSDLKAYALGMWANHIETGHVGMSATDARGQIEGVRRSTVDVRALGFSVKVLSPEQQQLVARLRALAIAEQASQRMPGLTQSADVQEHNLPESYLRSRARLTG